MEKETLNYLCCPSCKTDLSFSAEKLVCASCKDEYVIKDGIFNILPNITPDLQLTISKWDSIYAKALAENTYIHAYNDYKKYFYEDTYNQIATKKSLDRDTVYLEIGCGEFFFGQEIANKVKLIIGIDICPSALNIAKKMLDARGITNYLLIQGDIQDMPIKTNCVNLIYGGGAIEHFENTQMCINELYRVLETGGISINTVPYLNIGTLTYRQVWGNIPNLPVLKQIAEFVHIKILKGKHIIFGYEMSFLGSTLKKLHIKAGFSTIRVDKFRVRMFFDFAPKFLRKYLIALADNSSLFWPMVMVSAKK